MTRSGSAALRLLGALATLVVGAVHLQQYADGLSDVPTIGTLFLLNAAGAGVLAIVLATRRAGLGALGAIALSAGSLVAIAIAMTDGGLFAYTEPSFRTPVAISVAAEVAAIVLLAGHLLAERLPARPRVDWTATA